MGRRQKLDAVVRRVDATRLAVENPWGADHPLRQGRDPGRSRGGRAAALARLAAGDARVARRAGARRIAPFWGDEPGRLAAVVVTPDFHRGSGIPIGTVVDARGFVIPKAVGNDVCCGMRLLVTDLTRGEIEPILGRFAAPLRASFSRASATSRCRRGSGRRCCATVSRASMRRAATTRAPGSGGITTRRGSGRTSSGSTSADRCRRAGSSRSATTYAGRDRSTGATRISGRSAAGTIRDGRRGGYRAPRRPPLAVADGQRVTVLSSGRRRGRGGVEQSFLYGIVC